MGLASLTGFFNAIIFFSYPNVKSSWSDLIKENKKQFKTRFTIAYGSGTILNSASTAGTKSEYFHSENLSENGRKSEYSKESNYDGDGSSFSTDNRASHHSLLDDPLLDSSKF